MSVHQKVEQYFICPSASMSRAWVSGRVGTAFFVLVFCADQEKQTGKLSERDVISSYIESAVVWGFFWFFLGIF